MSKQERRLYEFGPCRRLPSERLLLSDGEPIQLTPKAFEMLWRLTHHASEGTPSFTPDGRRVVYAAERVVLITDFR